MKKVRWAKYHKIQPGEQMFWNCNLPVTVVCCDCGLVHNYHIVPKMKKGFILVKAYRDARRTAAFRRGKSKSLQRAVAA